METMWVKGGAYPARVHVKKWNGAYRDALGTVFSAKKTVKWDDLSSPEKVSAIYGEYNQRIQGAEWGISKDPELEPMKAAWVKEAKARLDYCLANMVPFVEE